MDITMANIMTIIIMDIIVMTAIKENITITILTMKEFM